MNKPPRYKATLVGISPPDGASGNSEWKAINSVHLIPAFRILSPHGFGEYKSAGASILYIPAVYALPFKT